MFEMFDFRIPEVPISLGGVNKTVDPPDESAFGLMLRDSAHDLWNGGVEEMVCCLGRWISASESRTARWS